MRSLECTREARKEVGLRNIDGSRLRGDSTSN